MILQTGLRTDMPRSFSPTILKQRLSNLARMDVFCEKTAKMRFSPQLLALTPLMQQVLAMLLMPVSFTDYTIIMTSAPVLQWETVWVVPVSAKWGVCLAI